MITLTESAAKKVGELERENGEDGKKLRIFVESGGCSGFQYGMSFDIEKDGDRLLDSQGVSFLMDEKSLTYMDGSEIDFDDGFECPDLFELQVDGESKASRHWVLWTARGKYMIGTFDGYQFRSLGPPERGEYAEAYAGQTYNDEPHGRRVQMSWLRPLGVFGDSVGYKEEPFTGMMTVPVELDLVRLPTGLPRAAGRSQCKL